MDLNEAVRNQREFQEEHKKVLKRMVIVFDLDHTLIDSSHRTSFKENGEFDLEAWREKQTWEYVQKDKLLPLYHHFLAFQEGGYTLIAVTARKMMTPDYRYLKENGLHFDFILERGDSLQLDWELKHGALSTFFSQENRMPFLFFDDKDENLKVAREFGFQAIKAQLINLKTVVKDYHSVRNVDETIEEVKPKEEDLAKSRIKYFKK